MERNNERSMRKKTLVTGLTALALTLAPFAAMPMALAHADSTTTYDPNGNGGTGEWDTQNSDGSSSTTTYDPGGNGGTGEWTTTDSPGY